jgi:hypothetical protein
LANWWLNAVWPWLTLKQLDVLHKSLDLAKGLKMSKNKLEIDVETADRITVISLKEHRGYLKKELKKFKKGEYLHPEDVVENTRLVQAMDLIIKYYGG